MHTTPFVRRMRTQGGTFFSFCSAMEDIQLNISERNNIVKMSHYALLNIPSIDQPDNLQQNKFNTFAIPGAYQSFLSSGSIKDGRVIIAESFQNYALNLETNILDVSSYNPALSTTISERVFWKWLKETGAVRWKPIDTCIGTYWKEETDTDSSVGYNSIVKCIGTIGAGSVRTDTFGTYNETYVLVPTSFGQTPVYFKQVEDDNYYHSLSIVNGNTNILGRETYLYPHPDALEFKAYYDLADSSSVVGSYTMQYDNSTGSWNNGWWWSVDGKAIADNNSYFVDSSSYISSTIYNIDLQYYYGSNYITFRRSKVDCMSIEYDLDKLKSIFNDAALSFDSLAIDYAEDDNFDFNTVLVYYSVYNKALDKVLATNLLGVLFLDPPSGNTSSYPISEILLPSLTKLQSGPSGFGTSYSFRINVKSDYMLDDTQAIVTDTTASQLVLDDFSKVFDSLEKSLSILNQHTGTINYITEQYLDITANQTNILNEITDIQYQVNDIARDITGTENTIAMFSDGDDPIVDSSIYMKNGKIGFFTQNPAYPVQFDVSIKVKDIIIENAIRDISGNIILGYGSPIQIGSSTNERPILMYTGKMGPAFSLDSCNNLIFDASITFRHNVIFDGSLLTSSGIPISGSGSGTGTSDVTKAYVDGSIANFVTNVSVNRTLTHYINDASLSSSFIWNSGVLNIDVSVVANGVTTFYVDGSFSTNASVNLAFLTNASLGNLTTKTSYIDACLGRISPLTVALNSSIGLYATLADPQLTSSAVGTPSAPTPTAGTNTTRLATTQFVMYVDASLTQLRNRHNFTETSVGYHDVSIKLLDSLLSGKANLSGAAFTGRIYAPAIDVSHATESAELTFTGGQSNAINYKIRNQRVGISNSGLEIYDLNASKSRLVIDQNGYVGINTSSPSGTLHVNGNVKSITVESSLAYVAGFNGYGFKLHDADGISSLEVNNLTVRNLLKAYTFEINELTCVGGTQVQSVANGIVYSVDGTNLYFDTDNNSNPISFAVDDYIRAQIYTGRGIDSYFGKVTAVHQSATLGSAYIETITINGTPWVNMKLVQFGNSSNTARQNIIFSTVADGSIYIAGLSDVSNGLFVGHEKFRLGDLTNINDSKFGELSGFGLYADNVYLKGKISANSGDIGGWDIDSSYLGKNTGFDASSAGMAPSDYPFYAGSEYANRTSAPFRVKNDGTMIATKFLYAYVLSDDILVSNDTEESTTSTSFVRLKKITLGSNVQGPKTLRIIFSTQGMGITSEAQIIRNDDVSVGTLVTGLDNDYQTLSEDISGWNAGDSICLYVRKTGPGVNTAYVKDFRLLGTHTTIANEVTGNAG